MASRKKHKAPSRRYTVPLTGELDGFVVVMAAMSTREVIAVQRGEMTEADVLDMVATRCLEHDFDTEDLRDLDYWIVAQILDDWGAAMQKDALPPTNGEPSPAP